VYSKAVDTPLEEEEDPDDAIPSLLYYPEDDQNVETGNQ